MSSDLLRRIKRAVLIGNYAFSEKALIEMEADTLTELDVAELILNAVAIYKTIRSQSPWRQQRTEYLHNKDYELEYHALSDMRQRSNQEGLP